MDAVHGNPYDGATLREALSQTQHLTTIKPKQAAVNKGFRGASHHPPDVEVVVAGTRKKNQALKRNYLRGKQGDRINAFLAGCGFNLRKLFRFFLSASLLQPQPIA